MCVFFFTSAATCTVIVSWLPSAVFLNLLILWHFSRCHLFSGILIQTFIVHIFKPPLQRISRLVVCSLRLGFTSCRLANKSKMNNLLVPQLPVLFLWGLARAGGAAITFPKGQGKRGGRRYWDSTGVFHHQVQSAGKSTTSVNILNVRVHVVHWHTQTFTCLLTGTLLKFSTVVGTDPASTLFQLGLHSLSWW